jgi:predicted esterase
MSFHSIPIQNIVKQSILVVLTLFLFKGQAQAQDDGGRQYATFRNHISAHPYAYYLPEGYDLEKSYPVIIGPGEGIEGSNRTFYWNVEDVGRFGWILIEFSYWKQNTTTMENLFKELRTRFKIEGDKFHILGYGEHSNSCFNHVISSPQNFHSITTAPGQPASNNENQLARLKEVKIRSIVGEKDQNSVRLAQEFEAIYKQMELNSTLEVIPDAGYDLKVLVGPGFMQRMEKLRQ